MKRFIILLIWLLAIPLSAQTENPYILDFSTTKVSVPRDRVEEGNLKVDVSWQVVNRPDNSNLVFEQVMPDGTLRNAELPREVEIVPSAGNGIVVPVSSGQNVDNVVFQVRLVDLDTDSTLDSKSFELPIVITDEFGWVEVSGDACFQRPFPADRGLKVGEQARTQRTYSSPDGDIPLSMYSDLTDTPKMSQIGYGKVVTIEDGPHCRYSGIDQTTHRRRWKVHDGEVSGWLDEYVYGIPDNVYFLVPASSPDVPTVDIESFSVSPTTIDADALDSTYLTFKWETRNAFAISLYGYGTSGSYDVSGENELRILASELGIISNPITFELSAYDTQGNIDYTKVELSLTSSVTIADFSASSTNPRAGTPVTFSWNIDQDFSKAYIQWVPPAHTPTFQPVTTITTNTGSYTFNIPERVAGTYEFTLMVDDGTGAVQSKTVKLNIGCAYDWGMGVSESDCPMNALATEQGAYQAFERGFMLYIPNREHFTIWAFYNDGTVYHFPDDWNGKPYTIDGTPPAGLLAPERGFGHVWSTIPGQRDKLGWATSAEQGYSLQYQRTLSLGRYPESRHYFKLPDGRMIKISDSIGRPYPVWEYK